MSLTKSRNVPTRKTLPLFFRAQVRSMLTSDPPIEAVFHIGDLRCDDAPLLTTTLRCHVGKGYPVTDGVNVALTANRFSTLLAFFHTFPRFSTFSYARGNDAIWNQFFGMIEPVASRVPWNVAPGTRVVSRSIPPQWRSIRSCPLICAYVRPMAGASCVQMRWADEIKKNAHPKHITALSREHVPNLAPLTQCRSSARLGSHHRSCW